MLGLLFEVDNPNPTVCPVIISLFFPREVRMGTSASVMVKQLPNFVINLPLTNEDISNCSTSWNMILSDDHKSPSNPSQNLPTRPNSIESNAERLNCPRINNDKNEKIDANNNDNNTTNSSNDSCLYRIWFYRLCYLELKRRIDKEIADYNYIDTFNQIIPTYQDNALHTIVIFMLKIISIYISSLKATKAFEKYAKSLALSSAHLGIRVRHFELFEKAFLETIQYCFQEQPNIVLSWKKLYTSILRIVLPECTRQESTTSMKRQLRLSGNSNLRDSPENDVITYYAEYAFRLISTVHNDENDLNSVNSRLSTSLHNSIENEHETELNRDQMNHKIPLLS